jgi:hypothetical protein
MNKQVSTVLAAGILMAAVRNLRSLQRLEHSNVERVPCKNLHTIKRVPCGGRKWTKIA